MYRQAKPSPLLINDCLGITEPPTGKQK